MQPGPGKVSLALAITAAACLAACAPAAPPNEGAMKAADDACTAVFNMRNGKVANVEEGGKEAVWGELNAAMAAGIDDRYSDLAGHLAKVKDELTDGNSYIGPGEGDFAVLTREIEAAAQECADLEDDGLV